MVQRPNVDQVAAAVCRGVTVLAVCLAAFPAAAGVKVNYLYNLARFDGIVPFGAVSLTVDAARNEVYVADTGERSIRIFSDSGMEIYRFGDSDELGTMFDVAVHPEGDIFLLSYVQNIALKPFIIHCNYRGDLVSRSGLTGLPKAFAEFRPFRLLLRGSHLYLADNHAMRVAKVGLDGRFVEGYDLGAAIGLSDDEVANSGMGGFDIDAAGNFLFSMPTMATVFQVTPGGEARQFGRPGGAPGRFGVVRGVAAGRDGMIYVVDTLRCVVMAFDRTFAFVEEFGYRHPGPGGLAAPRGIAVSPDEKVLVTQSSGRGVNVYRVQADQ